MTTGSVHVVCLTVLSLLVSRLGQSINQLITMDRLFDLCSLIFHWSCEKSINGYLSFNQSSRASLFQTLWNNFVHSVYEGLWGSMVPGEASTLSIFFFLLFLYLFLSQFLSGYLGRRAIFSRVNCHSFFQSAPMASYRATMGSASWRTSSATATSIATMVATNAAVVRISDNFRWN